MSTEQNGPIVPPPSERKMTAKETADLALAMSQDNARALEALGTGAVLEGGAADAVPSELAQKVADLDRDLEALAGHVNNLPARSAAPDTEALGSNLEALRASMNAAVTSLRDQDVHLGQELGSLGRAVSTLTERLAELDARPQVTEGEDATTARMNAFLRSVDEAMREHREDTANNLGALNRRLDRLATSATGEVVELTAPVPKVYGAMVDVMRKVKNVPKAGVGPKEAGKYAYRKLDDAVEAVGAALREVGLLLIPEAVLAHDTRETVVKHEGGTRIWVSATVRIRWAFIHPVDGSKQYVEMAGEGRDMGDKATGKAESNAWKNALIQALNIPVEGLDTEQDHPVIQSDEPTQDRDAGAQAATRPAQPADQARPLTVAEVAVRVHKAVTNLHVVHPSERADKLDQIESYARSQAGLMDWPVEGVSIGHHIQAARATLPAAPSQQPPPILGTDDDPWGVPPSGFGSEHPHGYHEAGDYS